MQMMMMIVVADWISDIAADWIADAADSYRKSSSHLIICPIAIAYSMGRITDYTSSSAIAERPLCSVGQLWRNVVFRIQRTLL